jgi:serine/threonine protein kinase
MTGPPFLTVRCPSCGATSDQVPARLAGRTVRCPRCAARFAVPSPGPPGPDPDAPAPTVAEAGAAAPTVAEAEVVAPTVAEDGAVAPTRAEEPSPAALATGHGVAWQAGDVVLGLYEVTGVLGEGGMGRVYRVRHRGWGLDLALKVPLAPVLAAAGGADLFVKEAETWVNLGLHPHVVTCHYVRRLGELPLVFAEYADGGSVHEAIRAGRLASAEAILDVAVQFAWGLHHAHEQGLVHRDVKPANVMLTSDGLAKVTDFGLARARPGGLAAHASGGHTMTVEGGGGATPAYVSPEQARGDAMSRRSDAWSFGLSVLEMFLGRRTWNLGLAAPEVLATIDEDGGPATPIPPRVRALLERCFQRQPDERPHDMAEIAAELRAAWETLTGRAYPRPEPKGGPGSPDALNNRAASLVDLGRVHEATGLWARALQA